MDVSNKRASNPQLSYSIETLFLADTQGDDSPYLQVAYPAEPEGPDDALLQLPPPCAANPRDTRRLEAGLAREAEQERERLHAAARLEAETAEEQDVEDDEDIEINRPEGDVGDQNKGEKEKPKKVSRKPLVMQRIPDVTCFLFLQVSLPPRAARRPGGWP